MRVTPPTDFSCVMHAHQRGTERPGTPAPSISVDTHPWFHVFRSVTAVRMCDSFAPVWKVTVTVDPEGPYWGWWAPQDDRISMIQFSKDLLNMCFPYGFSASEEAGHGHHVRLRIEPVGDRPVWPDNDL